MLRIITPIHFLVFFGHVVIERGGVFLFGILQLWFRGCRRRIGKQSGEAFFFLELFLFFRRWASNHASQIESSYSTIMGKARSASVKASGVGVITAASTTMATTAYPRVRLITS